jgi:hypothetical protein
MANRKPGKTDWRRRFDGTKPARNVMLHADFAGIRSGTLMHIGTPGTIAAYIARIPSGETRSIERLRNELARKHGATATCPVTTAIYLRIVAEVALAELAAGVPREEVVPFWRVIEPGSKIARRLTCDADFVAELRATEAAQPLQRIG